MREDQVKAFVDGNLSKIVLASIGPVYPNSFQTQALDCKEYCLDLPIVGHQMVCTEKAQILSFILMELNSFMAASARIFPAMARNESIKMLVSGNNEILNTASSKLAFILSKAEGRGTPIITPPVVMNYSGENKIDIICADAIFLQCQSRDFAFRFITTVQMV
jgi:hypothetical protein